MENGMLHCHLVLTPGAGDETAIAFDVRNPGRQAVTIHYFEPYIDFDLTARAADGPVSVVQPGYDTRARPATLTLDPGQTARIRTPFRLRFDPSVAPSGGEVPTVLTLRHAPARVRLVATMRLEGATPAPCEVEFDPAQP